MVWTNVWQKQLSATNAKALHSRQISWTLLRWESVVIEPYCPDCLLFQLGSMMLQPRRDAESHAATCHSIFETQSLETQECTGRLLSVADLTSTRSYPLRLMEATGFFLVYFFIQLTAQ